MGRWASRDPLGEISELGLYVVLGNDVANRADAIGLCTKGKDCDGKDVLGFDCHWTGAKTAGSATSADWATLAKHKLGGKAYAHVHWTGVCDATYEVLERGKIIAKPTPGSGPFVVEGNSASLGVESRWFAPTWMPVGEGQKGMGKNATDAMAASSADFCCCEIDLF